MDQSAYDDLLHRLTALVVKLETTYDALVEANRQQRDFNQEQREFNRQQLEINRNLMTLVARVFRDDDTNGRDA